MNENRTKMKNAKQRTLEREKYLSDTLKKFEELYNAEPPTTGSQPPRKTQ